MKINWPKITIDKLAAIVCKQLEKNNIDATIVGGACVSIYSENKYVSSDIDIVSFNELKDIKPILAEIGFLQKGKGNIFDRKNCPFYLQFVSPPLAIGREPVKKTNLIKTKMGTIKLLTATDCVKDRLAAYFYFNDPQSMEQAVLVAKQNKVSLSEVKKWAEKENQIEKYNNFAKILI